MCIALWRAIRRDAGDEVPEVDPQWATDLLDPIYRVPRTRRSAIQLVSAVYAPWWPAGKTAYKFYGGNGRKDMISYMLAMAVPFYIWLILLVLWILELLIGYGLPVGVVYIGWAVLMGFFAYLTGTVLSIISWYKVRGCSSIKGTRNTKAGP